MRIKCPIFNPSASKAAFALVEVLIAMSIAALTIGAIIYGYTSATNRIEWSVYSQAAQSLALQGVESVRAANWEPDVGKDEAINANFPTTNIVMDIPFKGTNRVMSALKTYITQISTNPDIKMIQVDCEWRFHNYSARGTNYKWFTNTIVTYRRPNQ